MKHLLCCIIFLCSMLSAAGAGTPSLGYSVSGRGFVLPGASVHEHGAVDLVWRPSDGYVTFRTGIAVPAGDGWCKKALYHGGLDLTLMRIRPHFFAEWISMESRFAPAAGIGFAGSGDIGGAYLSASLYPLRFEVGGGYISVLSPAVYADVFGLGDSFFAGWSFTLFDFGYYIW